MGGEAVKVGSFGQLPQRRRWRCCAGVGFAFCKGGELKFEASVCCVDDYFPSDDKLSIQIRHVSGASY